MILYDIWQSTVNGGQSTQKIPAWCYGWRINVLNEAFRLLERESKSYPQFTFEVVEVEQ
jgi:hypothetical protein